MSVLSKPYFHCEEAAFDHLESTLWPNGAVCPHCVSDRVTKLGCEDAERSQRALRGVVGKRLTYGGPHAV